MIYFWKCALSNCLNFYYQVRDPKLSGLKQQPFISSQFCRSEIGRGMVVFCALGITGWKQGVHPVGTFWRLWRRIQALGSLQSLMVKDWCSYFLTGCWLETAPRSTHIPCHSVPSIFKMSNKESRSHWTPPLMSLISPAGDQSCFSAHLPRLGPLNAHWR